MKRGTLALVLLLAVTLAFLAGTWVARGISKGSVSVGRKILYYVDPMHPSYKSDKPGIAPDCGMQLEPVYADGATGGAGASPGAPGTVAITAEKRQTIGVKVATIERSPWTGVVRLLGTVAPDEARTYRITAATDIWVRKVFPPTTGSIVRKDQPLAAYFTSGFLAAANNFLYAVDTRERHGQSADVSAAQAQNLDYQMRQAVANLINMGVSESQIEEMEKTGKASHLVEIRSPSGGFILERSVSVGQFIPVGSEMYRIADLDKVWILAETYENEGRLLHPGMDVKVTHPQKRMTFHAKVTEILPQFDPKTRTMKVRLEADNPGYMLRPDMFVDLEVSVQRPAALTVPAEAVIEAGTRRNVYIDMGDGRFEPRAVETGSRMGGRVEITKGLGEGERIVVSGTFLVDSESRMKLAAAGIYGEWHVDPVCGMTVDEGKANAAGKVAEHEGNAFFFCSDECLSAFRRDPGRYRKAGGATAKKSAPAESVAPHRGHGTPVRMSGAPARGVSVVPTIDPVCGVEVDPVTARTGVGVRVRQGKTYYFCSDECMERFDADPGAYLEGGDRDDGDMTAEQGRAHNRKGSDGADPGKKAEAH